MYDHTRTSLSLCIYIYICMYVYLSLSLSIYIYIDMHACLMQKWARLVPLRAAECLGGGQLIFF